MKGTANSLRRIHSIAKVTLKWVSDSDRHLPPRPAITSRETYSATCWPHTSSLKDCEKIHLCFLSHPIYGAVVGWSTNSELSFQIQYRENSLLRGKREDDKGILTVASEKHKKKRQSEGYPAIRKEAPEPLCRGWSTRRDCCFINGVKT